MGEADGNEQLDPDLWKDDEKKEEEQRDESKTQIDDGNKGLFLYFTRLSGYLTINGIV